MTGIDQEALATELLALGSATLYEASGLDCVLPTRLRPAWPGAAVSGRALPVRAAPGDNLALHHALERAESGDVLVVDGGQAEHGYWGEVMTVAALSRGILGLVIDGGVRDVDRLAELGFPAFSSSIALCGTVKQSIGTVGETLEFGGVPVARGDVVVADVDGVIVIPASEFSSVLTSARARAAAESRYLERLRAGELTLDIYGLRDR